jgi:hypothetical protein
VGNKLTVTIVMTRHLVKETGMSIDINDWSRLYNFKCEPAGVASQLIQSNWLY